MYLLKHATLATYAYNLGFTFHYVSIKTSPNSPHFALVNQFTFHYVSIKTVVIKPFKALPSLFTFHYVSIKTHGLK